ncbi:FAD-dependent oxidoreductase [Methylosinus sp. Sm6]|uniref:FAD-dependent oxidoreductase n=1 Tax=Methylosinus sp. Sm6 TaxID=2866948 RepID=UPI001C99CDBD|nr:FAD-dependent oxidoreductase [Methylosinus sp. Sm6]MBY6240995.1 FAD-dependent oxidoreductase [Methylosinus sp. Sm6]
MNPTPARRGGRTDGITRRDFVNGLLVDGLVMSAGGVPARALAGVGTGGACDGPIGLDSRVLRGGNLPSTFLVSHWLRDRRLGFQKNAVTIAPGCDDVSGSFPIVESGEGFDAIIVGGGLAGLSAAFHLLRERPSARLLILEAGPSLGGNAGRDEAAPLSGPAATAGAYCAAPASDWLAEVYRALGVDWDANLVEDPVDSFYLDETAPGVAPGYRGWNIDTFEKGLSRLPFAPKVVADLERARRAILLLGDAGVTDPADESEREHDALSMVSLAHYLQTTLGCDPVLGEFFTAYTLTAFGGTAAQVNAHSAIGFLASEFRRHAIFTFPGGTSELARRFQGWLGAKANATPRIESNATVLQIDPHAGQKGASLVYFQDNVFRRVEARRIVVAASAQSARRLVEPLADPARQEAWSRIHAAPIVVANVALRRAAPLLQLGLGFSQSWFGGRHFVNFTVADWAGGRRADPERATTLTFYGGCSAELDALAEARMALLHTPFADYEASLRSDLARLMRGADFDFDRDVAGLFVYRWGHSMLRPPPNWLFEATAKPGGGLDRAAAPRHIACAPLGPIVFAGQHAQGAPSVESALASGRRAALQALEGAP